MMALEQQSPSAAHWSQRQYETLFVTADNQQRSERFAWVAEEEENEAAGILAFMVAHQVGPEWELENIVVAEAARRRGVGRRLLSELIAHAHAARGSCIFLEGRESNQGARALYRTAGFEETGLRKSYYAGPLEDAILCRLRL
jgi:ribosomal-protein-alanine acetyltransferase